MAVRSRISKLSSLSLTPLFSSSSSCASVTKSLSLPFFIRPFLSLADLRQFTAADHSDRGGFRFFSMQQTTSLTLNSLSPAEKKKLPPGCDFEHWLIVMEAPDPSHTRDEIIETYIRVLASVLGSDDEAKKSIYSVSTKHYFAFGCIMSQALSYKIRSVPKVRMVLPDSYLDVESKDYGGEPFIDGYAVPYDPKYHEVWIRNYEFHYAEH